MLKIVDNDPESETETGLDALVRQGVQRMLEAALKTEVREYLERHQLELDDQGHRLVVGNGKAKARKVTTGAGTFEVAAPRVNDKRVLDGERQKFTSEILPPYMRKSPKVAEVLPLL